MIVKAVVTALFLSLLHFPSSLLANSLESYSDAQSFFQMIEDVTLSEREELIFQQIKEGNIPSFLNQLVPVSVQAKIDGKKVSGTIFVMPDYISIGHNDNYIRVPMTPILAQKVADHLGFMLPTPKIVDAIYKEASHKLAPAPLPYGPDMVTPAKFAKHNDKINNQLKSVKPGQLIAGHKKDIVLTKRLANDERRVAIYGWHRLNGRPIQPLSLAHDNKYADYSHGVRLVSKVMLLDGESVDISRVLQDDELATLVSHEGALPLEIHKLAIR